MPRRSLRSDLPTLDFRDVIDYLLEDGAISEGQALFNLAHSP